MTTLAWRLLALVLAAVGLVAGGYRWGSSASDNRHAATQLETERAASRAVLREVERGDQAQASLGEKLSAQQSAYSDLERAFNELRRRRAPLVVAAPLPSASAAAGPGAATSGPQPAQERVDQPAQLDLQLSAAAVWMWNSALAGTDTPAGACGLADPTASACAAASGVGFDAAADNQRENARICAEDRTRHHALIDFITQHQVPR